MTTPYTYIVKHLPSGKVYYGCRFAKGCNPKELWKSYFTSSKTIKKLVEVDGVDAFQFDVRQEFTDIDKCRAWETKVLKRLNVIKRQDLFLNKTNNIAFSRESSLKGIANRSKESYVNTGRTMGLSNKGRKHSAEVNAKKAQFGNQHKLGVKESEETRMKKKIAHTGKSSGMLGKSHPKCTCLICKKEMSITYIPQHYDFKHK